MRRFHVEVSDSCSRTYRKSCQTTCQGFSALIPSGPPLRHKACSFNVLPGTTARRGYPRGHPGGYPPGHPRGRPRDGPQGGSANCYRDGLEGETRAAASVTTSPAATRAESGTNPPPAPQATTPAAIPATIRAARGSQYPPLGQSANDGIRFRPALCGPRFVPFRPLPYRPHSSQSRHGIPKPQQREEPLGVIDSSCTGCADGT